MKIAFTGVFEDGTVISRQQCTLLGLLLVLEVVTDLLFRQFLGPHSNDHAPPSSSTPPPLCC